MYKLRSNDIHEGNIGDPQALTTRCNNTVANYSKGSKCFECAKIDRRGIPREPSTSQRMHFTLCQGSCPVAFAVDPAFARAMLKGQRYRKVARTSPVASTNHLCSLQTYKWIRTSKSKLQLSSRGRKSGTQSEQEARVGRAQGRQQVGPAHSEPKR